MVMLPPSPTLGQLYQGSDLKGQRSWGQQDLWSPQWLEVVSDPPDILAGTSRASPTPGKAGSHRNSWDWEHPGSCHALGTMRDTKGHPLQGGKCSAGCEMLLGRPTSLPGIGFFLGKRLHQHVGVGMKMRATETWHYSGGGGANSTGRSSSECNLHGGQCSSFYQNYRIVNPLTQ